VMVNNQDAPMGSALKRPPGRSKTKAAKAAGTAATKPNTPASSDYSKLAASSEAIAASIRYKSKMEMLMKEAEMYFRFGEKDKALEIMAKVEHLCHWKRERSIQSQSLCHVRLLLYRGRKLLTCQRIRLSQLCNCWMMLCMLKRM
jgi:hypothetical protein